MQTDTGIYPEVTGAQLCIESDYGQSVLARQFNNLAGCMWVPESIAEGQTTNGGYARYASVDQFFLDYTRILKLPYYSAVRAGQTPEEQAYALGESPYASGHYMAGGKKGQALIDVMDQQNFPLAWPPATTPTEPVATRAEPSTTPTEPTATTPTEPTAQPEAATLSALVTEMDEIWLKIKGLLKAQAL